MSAFVEGACLSDRSIYHFVLINTWQNTTSWSPSLPGQPFAYAKQDRLRDDCFFSHVLIDEISTHIISLLSCATLSLVSFTVTQGLGT